MRLTNLKELKEYVKDGDYGRVEINGHKRKCRIFVDFQGDCWIENNFLGTPNVNKDFKRFYPITTFEFTENPIFIKPKLGS